MPGQIDVIRRHVADAVRRGARRCSAARSRSARRTSTRVLVDVPEDSPAVRRRPSARRSSVNRVADVDEAIGRANATAYGLGATVFATGGGR